jgi:hypothetical protein
MDEETSNQYSPDQSTAHTGNHDKETVNLDRQTSDQETSDQESIDEETTDQESIEDESFERYHVDQNGTVRKWTTTMRTNGRLYFHSILINLSPPPQKKKIKNKK